MEWLIYGPMLAGFITGVIKYWIIPIVQYFRREFIDIWREPPMRVYIEDIPNDIDPNRLERIENYDRQIDGYTQLIKLLDAAYRKETDTKKQAAILSKQLTTLEKLNKTVEKREKLE